MRKTLRRVRKEDYERVILTETLPYEVPIIFSNFGIYELLKRLQKDNLRTPKVFKYLLSVDAKDYTIPLTYKIRKDEKSFRVMSLLHPATQVDLIKIYRDYGLQIIRECSKSKFSIRAPAKIASKYYSRGDQQDAREFKSSRVSLARNESRYKHLTSYFSYGGYTRLYQFFDSYQFLNLERQYSSFWTLDVSKFFDSIYTHSISWALKEKGFSKINRSVENTLGAVFDRSMQASNYNETAGIVIGPEVSRIFAELIFQEIDRNIESALLDLGLDFGSDYVIRRYVDDIFIFSTSDQVSEVISGVIESHVKPFKLNLNSAKTLRASRPFVTQKTRSLRAVKRLLKTLEEKLVYSHGEVEGVEAWTPKKIYNKKQVIISFVNDAKSACIDDPSAYAMICGFLITSLTNMLKRFCRKNSSLDVVNDDFNKYHGYFSVILELVFHFFTVNPSHSGSVRLCMLTFMVCDFYENKFQGEADSIKSIIYTSSLAFFQSSAFKSLVKQNNGSTLLEALNVLATLKQLGGNYLLSRQALCEAVNFSKGREFSYFEIITLLYYMGDENEYSSLRMEVEKQIKRALSTLSDVRQNSAKCYLLMDVLTSPFVGDKLKNHLQKLLYKQVFSKEGTAAELAELTEDLSQISWCTSWKGTALLSSLEKKELLKGY